MNWLYICEDCGYTVRDDMPHNNDLKHLHDDRTEHTARRIADDGRELPVDQDLTHPDNPGMWMA